MLCFSVLLVEPITASAENSYTHSYELGFSCYTNGIGSGYHSNTFNYEGNTKPFHFIVRYKSSSSNVPHYLNIYLFEKGTNFTVSQTELTTYSSQNVGPKYTTYTQDSSFTSTKDLGGYNGTCSVGFRKFTYNDVIYCWFSTDVYNSTSPYEVSYAPAPIFYWDHSIYENEMLDLCKSVIDGSAVPDEGSFPVDEPLGPGPELIKHDFSQDIINPDIPLPQLSKISHEGFTIGNRGDYSAEVIMESSLLGVKFESQTIGMGMSSPWHFVPDSDWVYQGFYYNIADSSEVLIGTDEVNIKELYGYDNISNLIQAFKVYSDAYPKANTLPSYTWLKSGWNHIYVQDHVYNSESDKSDYEQLVGSGQARTSYYVRFVGSDGSTGQWVKYSFQDAYGTINNGMVYEGSLNVGVVEPDVNGNPVVKDEVSGSVNYENGGSIQYTPPASSTVPTVNQTELDTSLSGFQSTLEQFGSSTATVSKFTTEMFGFLPGWCTALIGLGIAGVVILRFLGR